MLNDESTRGLLAGGASIGRFLIGGVSSSSLNVKSTICGIPRFRDASEGLGRTDADGLRDIGGREAGVGTPVSSSSSSSDTTSALGTPNESLRSSGLITG